MTAKTLTVRERLLAVINKVPHSIIVGGHQTTINYKAWVVKARKQAENKRTTDSELGGLLNHWESMNRERLL
jgi:hypothetical protein